MLDSQGRTYFQVKLPMRIFTSSKKKTALNLNVYRNLHFRSLSAQKNKFGRMMKPLLKDIRKLGRVHLHYDIFPQTRTRLDVMNVGSIVDKYFSDSLVNLGVLEDDSYDFIDFVSFGFGGLVKAEYVLVTITEIEKEREVPMRVLLDEIEIQAALEAYVESMGLNGSTGVEMTTGDDGSITAEIMFGTEVAGEPKDKPAPKKKRGGRPFGSKNKPKEDPDAVETTGSDSGDQHGSGTAGPEEAEDPETTSGSSTEADKPADSKADSTSSKNLFGESPEESSSDGETSQGDSPAEEESGDKTGPKVTVKGRSGSSIFDT